MKAIAFNVQILAAFFDVFAGRRKLLLLVFWGDCCHSPIARTKSNIFRALEDAH
jgi:hypothetical protein